MPDERPRVLRLPRDETTAQTHLLAESHAARLPGQERICSGLDHEPVHALRLDLSPKALRLLEQRHLGARRALQQPKRRGEPGNPAPNHRNVHHAASTDPRNHAAACASTVSESASMKSGSSLSIGTRSSRTPRARAYSRALMSTS